MSDRPAPKFQVGEEVVYLSEARRPGKWLDGVIAEAKYAANGWTGTKSGKMYPPGWKYRFVGQAWSPETHIRKRPKFDRADQSFTELLQSIQQPNKVKA